MSVSVLSALKIGGLRECQVVAGHNGLSKPIKNVTIMEVPDIVRWLKGNELLLTSLYPVKDDERAQRELIQKLKAAGTSALAVKPYHFVKSIPEAILEEADKCGFPIIEIPEHISYLDILSPVMNTIFDNKVVLQEDLEQASQILNEISLNAQGIDTFIETLGYLTKNTITVESQYSFITLPEAPFALSPLTDEEQDELTFIRHPILINRKYEEQTVPCIVAPIMLNGRVFGNITCWGVMTDHSKIDLAILEKASSLLSLEFLKLKVKYDVEQQFRNDFLRELLFNESMNKKDLNEWGEKYHFDLGGKYVCLLLSGENGEQRADETDSSKVNEVDHAVRKRWPGAIVGEIRQLICVVLPVGDGDDDGEHIKSQCKVLLNDLKVYTNPHAVSRMSVGRVNSGIKGLRLSFYEAEQAIRLQRRINHSQDIIYYDDLGVYRLLGQPSVEKECRYFYKETIGKLVDYDKNHDLKLVESLKAYFQNNENLKETSEFLYIHVNTLKYRINKISVISGYSLNKTDEKMMLYLGLKVHDMGAVFID
ncbi:CdaR family transcriptional regulator [Scopulibacillus darangshiensis]|uniref:CdaR family transcriptional regulator n=1 Tax=Scopulibacillus darangshiensis TaxID=442528 RepID=A0A4R2NH61_9BACL|nr:PucR family transcriptional regulator [Scopulibacillus darangshiensis]TCP20707.1 CdaR family transcriptional regulator [Scopulibacillus darangshiensis]